MIFGGSEIHKYAFNVMVGDGGTDISDEEYDMIAIGQGVSYKADHR